MRSANKQSFRLPQWDEQGVREETLPEGAIPHWLTSPWDSTGIMLFLGLLRPEEAQLPKGVQYYPPRQTV